jgi:uncharacterized membrane protein YqjE
MTVMARHDAGPTLDERVAAAQPDAPAASPAGSRSTAELAGDLVRQTADLVHHELELAKVELSEKARRAGLAAGIFGLAGGMALIGAMAVTACVIAAIAMVLPVWAAALIIGGAALVGAALTAALGAAQLRRAVPPVPEEFLERTKEDAQWLRTQVKSEKS